MTPIIKAAFTEYGFTLSSKALQVFGGYGYTSEFPIEQTMRDSRIAMIYEGSNEIQANDLLVRKVLADGGESFNLLLGELRVEAKASGSASADVLNEICTKTETIVSEIRSKTGQDPEYPYRAAGSFMDLCAILLQAFAWVRTERCLGGLEVNSAERLEKEQSVEFFFSYLLPQFDSQVAAIRAASARLPFVSLLN